MTLTLRRLEGDELVELAHEIEQGYAEQMEVHGGFPREAARRKAARDTEGLLVDDTTVLYLLEADGETVGHLWLGEREGDYARLLWVYDVYVDDAYRGRGFGREALLLAEEEARRRGLTRVGLNVFGGNVAARNLYRSLGYGEIAVAMGKDV